MSTVTTVAEYDLEKINDATDLHRPIPRCAAPTILGRVKTGHGATAAVTAWMVATTGKNADTMLHLYPVNNKPSSPAAKKLSLEEIAEFMLDGPHQLVFTEQEMLTRVRKALAGMKTDPARQAARMFTVCTSLARSTRIVVLTRALAAKMYVPNVIDTTSFHAWVDLLCPEQAGDEMAAVRALYKVCRRGTDATDLREAAMFKSESFALQASTRRSVNSKFALYRVMGECDDTWRGFIDIPDEIARHRHVITGDVNHLTILATKADAKRMVITAEASIPWRFKTGSTITIDTGLKADEMINAEVSKVESDGDRIIATIVCGAKRHSDDRALLTTPGARVHAWEKPYMPFGGGRRLRGQWTTRPGADNSQQSKPRTRDIPVDVVVAGAPARA